MNQTSTLVQSKTLTFSYLRYEYLDLDVSTRTETSAMSPDTRLIVLVLRELNFETDMSRAEDDELFPWSSRKVLCY